jgi:hypothetical protein
MENEKSRIELPDWDTTTTGQDIVADNIRALEPAYFAAMLEEMKVFQVADKLVELFQSGLLPIGHRRAGGMPKTPNDALVSACDNWLPVNGVPDDLLGEF